MKNKDIVRQTRLEQCIAWGFPSVVICSVSLLVAVSIGKDFSDSSVVEVIVFLTSNLFFWLLYVSVFQFLPQDMLASLTKRKRSDEFVSIVERRKNEKEVCREESAPRKENGKATDTGSTPEELTNTAPSSNPAPLTASDIHAIYEQRNRQRQSALLQRRERILTSIRGYILDVLSPFVDMEALRIIQEDVMAWADDREHNPIAVDVRNGWSTLDCRHFIWNITARLRLLGGDYPVFSQGLFIKRMFPAVCKDAEAEYLGKNLTIKPNEGFVRIDKPDKDDWRFSFEKDKETDTSHK